MKTLLRFSTLLLVLTLFNCKPSTTVPELGTPTLPDVPMAYSAMDLPYAAINSNSTDKQNLERNMRDNPRVTDWGATLGRVLFYDTRLSLNNAVSCASCHKQSLAFADPVAHSSGFEGRLTPRNSMSIINPLLMDNLFWDSRAGNTIDLTLQPVQNHIEMGMEDLDQLTEKLAKEKYYKDLFIKAYGSSDITEEKISRALAQFLCSMTTFRSKYDNALRARDDFDSFTPLEKAGKELFFSDRLKCASCHSGINFAAQTVTGPYTSTGGTANIGLDQVPTDQGRGGGKFRIPSLRNIALTAPYMHDGRFATLDEVLEHYSSGIKDNPFLDPKFRTKDGRPKRLHLSSVEKEALKAFLNTLTDKHFTTDKKYSNPFKS